ncbi:BREX-2 system adenine-specific DNA-methyltransferase PglX [Gordonia phosphorivorans]|uniref:site-specific DNA-methyltransferase (adenine-specific) n=1 Tax=Gordonia phosphorivorans TaxID=1056982 RepID=A0ABV6H8C5_9ACTN
MSLATLDGAGLKTDLVPQLNLLIDDLRTTLTADPQLECTWRDDHRRATTERRTAASWTDWCDDQLTQAAVGWLLTSVFVRFCEDNRLLGDDAEWITHPDSLLRQRALDAEQAFYRTHPDFSYREWLEAAFDVLRRFPATESLVDAHAALHILSPSSDAIHQLLAFWRRTDDAGNLVWRFDDPTLSTRFLGDLYQDLSDFAKKKYALLQTPEFVEEFILDQTLEPALADRPLEGFTVIDPTCGSGHFLLGAFTRLTDRWHRHAPALPVRARVDNALASVYGVDLNPFAVAIAKFRLIVAALQACGETSLVNAPAFTLNLATGDSLLYGTDKHGAAPLDYGDAAYDKDAVASGFSYSTEDAPLLRKILAPGQYDVVVGNPPYINVSDKALNARYREIYHSCFKQYALSVPFMERFFTLAKPGDRAGWVGQITSNSFMKRRFGIPLIEEFLPTIDLARIIDSEGAWIPGHNMDGTPTVILIGRNRPPRSSTVRTVMSLGVRETPDDAADGSGPYWKSIVDHIDQLGYEDQWISIVDLPRDNLREHPWSLSGGGAVELSAAIDQSTTLMSSVVSAPVGRSIRAGADEGFMLPAHRYQNAELTGYRTLLLGEEVRNWTTSPQNLIFYPYAYGTSELAITNAPDSLWFLRRLLEERRTFQGNMSDSGLTWWSYMQHTASAYATPLSITFAEVATHNHFVLDRGGKVFKQTAPVIKLPENATEEDHLRLMGTLNSSVACFWLRQKTKPKGGAAGSPWLRTHQLNGKTVEKLPLPAMSPTNRARRLDDLAQELLEQEPATAIRSHGAKRDVAVNAEAEHTRIRSLMVAEQEELDWEVYRNYGLIDEKLYIPQGDAPGITSSERAFAIKMARQMQSGDLTTDWFTHKEHRFSPVIELPTHWSADYRTLVERRLAAIESNPFINLLERPEYKRRWEGETWDAKLRRALADWLLDRLEDPQFWFTPQGTPQVLSVAELAGRVETDTEFLTALDLWAGKKDAPVTDTLVSLLKDEPVPYLAALRYKDSGLRKRAEWERIWDLQRDEDAGLIQATDIPVPPKYTGTDFAKPSYWSHRGKLDVPKERFISYPGAGRATDPTPLLGWAGWNHAQQGLALALIYALREQEGVPLHELIPVVAGIAELLPWVRQWHTGPDPHLGLDLADYLTGQLTEKSAAIGVPIPDLSAWRPPKTTRGRKKK